MFDKGKAEGIGTRGVADHGFVRSIYFKDPDGMQLEFATWARELTAEDVDYPAVAAEELKSASGT